MPPVPAMLKGNATGAGLGVGGAHAVGSARAYARTRVRSSARVGAHSATAIGSTHAPAIGSAIPPWHQSGNPPACSTWNAKIRRNREIVPLWHCLLLWGERKEGGVLQLWRLRHTVWLFSHSQQRSTWNMFRDGSATHRPSSIPYPTPGVYPVYN